MAFGKIIGSIAGGLAGSATNWASSKIFGGSEDKRQQKQQNALNEQAAETNYKYGEMAAQNAFDRQMQAYERSFEDQTASAQVKRLKEAGLNPALMYGGGAAGGQPGQMVSTGQPSAGGAQAGAAEGGASKQQAATNSIMAGLEMQRQKSEIAVNESTAAKQQAEAKSVTESTKTEVQKRDQFLENLHQEGLGKWLENIANRWKLEGNVQDLDNENTETSEWNHKFGEVRVANNGSFSQYEAAQVAKAWGEANNNESLAQLNEERAQNYWQELLNATIHAQADQVRAAAAKLSAEFDTGEQTNWKTWADLASKISGDVFRGIGVAKAGRWIGGKR